MLNKLYFKTTPNLELINQIIVEKSTIGYYDLPYQNIDYIDDYLQKLDKRNGLHNIQNIVIVGIGGSSLGIRAIYHFVKANKKLKKIHFIDSTDPSSITNTLTKINVKKAHFIVISKSGLTLETIATYKYLLNFINKKNFSFITDKGSKLEQHAKANNALIVNIQPKIGGRFSALSSVGLIPLALVGIDIKALLSGAKEVSNHFFNGENYQDTLLQKAYFYAYQRETYHINTIFSYSESLHFFNQWFVQLWGESLGKKQKNATKNVGLTPIGLIGPKDQHSFLQLITEGTPDKTVTFIKIKAFNNRLNIGNIKLRFLEELDIINNLSFSDLINMQADSIIESLQKTNVPIDEIILKQQDEFSIGQLIFYYQLLTSLTGILLDVNTYDQPGVEHGKQILMQKLNLL